MFDIELTRCRVDCRLEFRVALGVRRLVALAGDPDARLRWRRGVARLRSRENRRSLLFVLTREWARASGYGEDAAAAARERTALALALFGEPIEWPRIAPAEWRETKLLAAVQAWRDRLAHVGSSVES